MTMTMIGLFFTAEQTVRVARLLNPGGFNLTLFHQLQESSLILAPRPSKLLVGIQHFPRGREERHMPILNSATFVEKIYEILVLGVS
jgi:hypothetical protein